MNEILEKAIRDANKLGARGARIIGIIEPQSACDEPCIKFIVDYPQQDSAGSLAWYME